MNIFHVTIKQVSDKNYLFGFLVEAMFLEAVIVSLVAALFLELAVFLVVTVFFRGAFFSVFLLLTVFFDVTVLLVPAVLLAFELFFI